MFPIDNIEINNTWYQLFIQKGMNRYVEKNIIVKIIVMLNEGEGSS